MSRVPFDIQFLVESILDESPDGVKLLGKKSGGSDESDPIRLNGLGAKVPMQGIETHWMMDDAYAFFFDHAHGVIIYSNKHTHGDMEKILSTAAGKAKAYPATFKNMYKIERDKFNNISLMSYKDKENSTNKEAAVIGFINLKNKDNDIETVRSYLAENQVYFRYLNIRGKDDEANEPSGRIWVKKNLISFWNTKEKTMRHFSLVDEMMRAMQVDGKKFAYEFLDGMGLFAYKELHGEDNREKLTPEEMRNLMAIQHLDPKAKEKLIGLDYKDKQREKAAKGFDFPAQADAAMPALEGHIMMKNLLHKGKE